MIYQHPISRPVIEVEHLVKSYPGVKAVDGISFHVAEGEIFGLLGPNGAGKSTTLSIVEGVRRPDSGTVRVLGLDLPARAPAVKRRIGVQLQSTSLLPDLTAVEQIELFARLYGRTINRATALALLARVSLDEKASALPATLSGGQQQRLALALALVNDPEIIFLDEPTAGLDPQARHSLWDLVRGLCAEGRTVVLTTHYMEEAEALCHRIGIVDGGKLLALDTPGALITTLQGRSSITTAAALPAETLAALPGVHDVQTEGGNVRLQTDDVPATIGALLEVARRQGVSLRDLHVQQPSLEDVFLQLTGRSIRA
ncbi:MAG TPA: ABC transporter ATP-binding protein [Chloroflexia bacterium]|nr:ABC transporter ATP-binding protein [Chloroflexia bacterium]